MSPTRRLAGIDIGTLTCRLLIADVQPRQPLKALHSDRRILRLGEGVDRSSRLNSAAMGRVLTCLQEWQAVIDTHQVDGMTVVATSAVRDADNRDEFVGRVRHETGFDVEVLAGDEEARRTLLGIRSGLSAEVDEVLALDIGGGSTEFILHRRGTQPLVRSIDLGVVRLCERVLHNDPPTQREILRARDWISSETKTAMAGMEGLEDATFVGTAGTITSLAAMAQRLPCYEPARIHNYVLHGDVIRELEQQLVSRTMMDRVGMPGLEQGREEVIVAGAIILRTILDTLGRRSIVVSDLGLREGVLVDLGERLGTVEGRLHRN